MDNEKPNSPKNYAKEPKQVILVRKDLKMRRGKEIAQSCHASLAVFFNLMKDPATGSIEQVGEDFIILFKHHSAAMHEWMTKTFKKICLQVNSEEELKSYYEQAKAAGLPCSLILDMAHTEFDEPTYTCVAIGPAYSEEIDVLTKDLKLY